MRAATSPASWEQQKQKIAETVHSFAKELGGMGSGESTSGPITDLAKQASAKVGEIGHFLETREPREILDEVSAFARRRPGLFLVLCGAAGVIAGQYDVAARHPWRGCREHQRRLALSGQHQRPSRPAECSGPAERTDHGVRVHQPGCAHGS